MRAIWYIIAAMLLAQVALLEDPEIDPEKAINDVEEDPLMAPINNDLDDEKPSNADGDVEFVPLPQMSELFKDSENILNEEKSNVRRTIHQEEVAMEEEGRNGVAQDVDMDATDEEIKPVAIAPEATEPIFNTDDFDDHHDDVDGSMPQGPAGSVDARL
jgi:hypothetical protein